MKKLNVIFCMMLSGHVFAGDVLHPIVNPMPGCHGIDLIGTNRNDGSTTETWIMGETDPILNDDCMGLGLRVDDNMQEGDFGYGIRYFNIPDFISNYQKHFTIITNNAFQSLNNNDEVTVSSFKQSYNSQTVADLVLRKKEIYTKHKGGVDKIYWELVIKWRSGLVSAPDEVFEFGASEPITVTYVWDGGEENLPVSLISLGGKKISMDPFQSNSSNTFSESFALRRVDAVYLGVLGSSTLLKPGDKVKFRFVQDSIDY